MSQECTSGGVDECGWDVLSNKCAYVPAASPVLVRAPSGCARFTHLESPTVLLPANPGPKDNITVVGTNLYPVREYSIAHHYKCIFRDSATNASVAITVGEWASPTTLHCMQPELAVTDPSGLGAPLTVTVQLQGPGVAVELDDALLGTVQLYNCSSIRTARGAVSVAVAALTNDNSGPHRFFGLALLQRRARRAWTRRRWPARWRAAAAFATPRTPAAAPASAAWRGRSAPRPRSRAWRRRRASAPAARQWSLWATTLARA